MSKTGGDDSEPKENDKCIAPPNSGAGAGDNGVGHCVEPEFSKKSKMTLLQERMDSAKQVINKRHKLIIAILSILVFILLLIVIILAVSLGGRSNYSQDMCVTWSCLSAASSVIHSVNASADPCNDFWSYSCGGWIDQNALLDNKGFYSIHDQTQREINFDIRHYIDLVRGDDDRTADWKVKSFYKSCMDDPMEDTGVFVHKIQVDFKGWEATGTFSRSTWTLQDALEKAFSVYGVNPFFSVTVDVDDFNVGSHVIKIEPDGLGLPNRDFYDKPQYEPFLIAYKNLIAETAVKFGVVSTDASNLANNLVSLEKRLAELLPSLQIMKTRKILQKKRIKDLSKDNPRIKWTQLLQSIYKKGITDSTYVLVAYPSYFAELGQVISSIDDRLMNNYIVWRLIHGFLPYFSGDLGNIYNQFLMKLDGVETPTFSPAFERWEFCVRTTTKFLGEAVGSLYIRNKVERDAYRSEIATIFTDTLLPIFTDNIDSYRWVRDDKSSSVLKNKVKELMPSTIVGFRKFITDTTNLSLHYNNFIVTRTFFTNILAGVLNKRVLESSGLDVSSMRGNTWNVNPTDVKVQYQYAGNQMFIPSGMFRYPYYQHNVPIAMKFGALGFHIASQMLRMLTAEGLLYDPQGKMYENADVEWISEDTLLAQNNTQECFAYDISSYQPKEIDYNVDSSLTSAQAFADVLGLKLAYESYKKYSSKSGEPGILPGLSLSHDKLFFTSLAQSMCENVRRGYAKSHFKSLTTLPAKQRIELLFRQSKSFQSAFGCEEKAKICRV